LQPGWIELTRAEQLNEIDGCSALQAVVILKHSTRCSISRFVLKNLVHDWSAPAADIPFYYLDLLQYRDISDEIARRYQVTHQSPQLLIISKARCVYSTTHDAIDADQSLAFIQAMPG
jgi:bacillithiol system protein YtxJ